MTSFVHIGDWGAVTNAILETYAHDLMSFGPVRITFDLQGADYWTSVLDISVTKDGEFIPSEQSCLVKKCTA